MAEPLETLISVDVETSGPIPGKYSLLSIGACAAYASNQQFECLIKPITDHADPKALEVSGLSLDTLQHTGLDPAEAMTRFEAWARNVAGPNNELVFVGLNAPFDWSFVNYYFHKYLGHNPFGFTALDIKAFYMGVVGGMWGDTRSTLMQKRLCATMKGDHDALHDALAQAELFRLIRAQQSFNNN